MFSAKTKRIKILSEFKPEIIEELEEIFNKKTNVYIDFANILHWQERLNWHICLKRLKQFLDSFTNIQKVKFYFGTLTGDINSEQTIRDAKKYGYEVTTKPVKIIPLSIDVSSISINSPDLLKDFIRKPLLQKLNLETIEIINKRLNELNNQGIKYLEDKKCNFDVEIGVAMEIDLQLNNIENFVLWSGDSDFENPVNKLLKLGKKVVIFMTARRISSELAETKAKKFEIKRIKEFICWAKELPEEIQKKTL